MNFYAWTRNDQNTKHQEKGKLSLNSLILAINIIIIVIIITYIIPIPIWKTDYVHFWF